MGGIYICVLESILLVVQGMKVLEMEDSTWFVGVFKDIEKMGEEVGCIKMFFI